MLAEPKPASPSKFAAVFPKSAAPIVLESTTEASQTVTAHPKIKIISKKSIEAVA